MSLFARITRFARSPRGKRLMNEAVRYASSPKGKKQITAARQRLAARRRPR